MMSRPTICASSSPRLGRCIPVAMRMVMASRAMPAASRVSSRGGRMIRLGTGRVISEITMQALVRPRASCPSGGLSIGRASAWRTAAAGSGRGSRGSISNTTVESGSSRFTTSRPHCRSAFIHHLQDGKIGSPAFCPEYNAPALWMPFGAPSGCIAPCSGGPSWPALRFAQHNDEPTSSSAM